jgi:hypothetical protein
MTGNRGISFIQVIMASTAIAGLALVGLRLAQGQRELVNQVYANRLSHYLNQEIAHLLKRSSVCSSTFTGKDPEGGSVRALSEFLESDEGQVVNTFFPVKGAREGVSIDGSYFEGRVTLLSYDLTARDESKVANISKGVTMLRVRHEVSKAVVEKSFPIKFSKDSEGKIAKCQLFEPGQFVSSGKWEAGIDGLKLIGPKLIIGSNETGSQKIETSGEVRLEERGTLPSCDESREGLMINEKGGRLKVCRALRWEPLGEQRFHFEEPTSYILSLTSLGSVVKFTKKHRLCYLNKMKKNSLSDGCQIRRISPGYESEYELKIFSSSDVTNSECEVSCVD